MGHLYYAKEKKSNHSGFLGSKRALCMRGPGLGLWLAWILLSFSSWPDWGITGAGLRKETETQGDLGEARRENWEDLGVGQTSVVCCCHP